MFLSKSMINNILNSKNLDDKQLKQAFDVLGYNLINIGYACEQKDGLEICHVGSSHQIKETGEYLSLVDIGNDLPSVTITPYESNSGDFIIFARNFKNVHKKGKIEPRRENELKTEGYLCTLADLGYNAKILDYNKLNTLLPINTNEDLSKQYGDDSILDQLGVIDSIFEIETKEDFYEVVTNLAFYFRKKPIRGEHDELDHSKYDGEIKVNVDSDDLAVAGFQIAPVRKIFEIDKTNWKLYTPDYLLLDKLAIADKYNIFSNIASFIKYETSAVVVFLKLETITGELKIKHHNDTYVIYDGDKLIYNQDGYVDQSYIPSKETEKLVILYLFNNKKRTNIDFTKNRVGYWLQRYLISNQSSQIKYFANYELQFRKINFNMSDINTINESKIRINQVTKLLRFFDVDVKEFKEHNGEFIITNINNKFDSLTTILAIIDEKLKLNRI